MQHHGQQPETTPPSARTHRTLRGLLWTSLSQSIEVVMYVAVLMILARLITPAAFGVVTAALTIIRLCRILMEEGLRPAVVQPPNLTALQIRVAFTIALAFGTLLAVALVVLAPVIAQLFLLPDLTPVLVVLSLSFVLQGLSIVAGSLLMRELRFRLLAWVEMAAFALGYGGMGITLALLGWGYWALVGAHLAQVTLRTAALVLIRPHPMLPAWERTAARGLLVFGSGAMIGDWASFLAHNGDKVVAARWLGPEALALHGRAYEFMSAPSKFLAGVFDKALFPALAAVQNDRQRIIAAFRRGTGVTALALLPASLLVLVLAPEMIQVLYGSQWSRAVLPLQIMAPGAYLRMGYKLSENAALAMGAVYPKAWRQAAYALLVLAGAWVGRFWGLPGVAAGVLLAIAINFIAMAQLSLKVLGMTWGPFWAAHVPGLALAALAGAETWLVAAALRSLGLAPLALLAVWAAVMLVSLWVLLRFGPVGRLGPDMIWLAQTAAAYLPSRLNPISGLTPKQAGVEAPSTAAATERRGMIVALIGADGAGKSSLVADAVGWLAGSAPGPGRPQPTPVSGASFGAQSGPATPLWRLLLLALRLAKSTGLAKSSGDRWLPVADPSSVGAPQAPEPLRLLPALGALLLAWERQTRLRRVLAARARGAIVVCDRYPQLQVSGFDDGPLLGPWLASSQRLWRTLAQWELSVYQQAAGAAPDLVIKLHVSPEVACARRPAARMADTRRRSAVTRALQYPPTTRVVDVDADGSFAAVARQVRQAISELLSRPGANG